MYEDVAGKRVLIVGASGGIGFGLCHALNDLGAEVVATSKAWELVLSKPSSATLFKRMRF